MAPGWRWRIHGGKGWDFISGHQFDDLEVPFQFCFGHFFIDLLELSVLQGMLRTTGMVYRNHNKQTADDSAEPGYVVSQKSHVSLPDLD